MKTDGRLARCAHKGPLGDALYAVHCGCGHNIRKILAHLRTLLAALLASFLRVITQVGHHLTTGQSVRTGYQRPTRVTLHHVIFRKEPHTEIAGAEATALLSGALRAMLVLVAYPQF
jgi:IS5 family transposase